MQTLEINTGIQIAKSPHDVFEAIVDGQKMSNYFISESSGRMEAGKEVQWRFAEFDISFPVQVHTIEKDRYVSFYWHVEGKDLLVAITLTPTTDNATIVKITEGKMDNDDKGINWLKGNTEGWANFLACLKAYLEYGINLRKGGFDYRKS